MPSSEAKRILAMGDVLKDMDEIRRHPDFSFEDPDTIYFGAACKLAELIVDQGERLTRKQRHEIAAIGAIMLRHLADITGFETIMAYVTAREAEKARRS